MHAWSTGRDAVLANLYTIAAKTAAHIRMHTRTFTIPRVTRPITSSLSRAKSHCLCRRVLFPARRFPSPLSDASLAGARWSVSPPAPGAPVDHAADGTFWGRDLCGAPRGHHFRPWRCTRGRAVTVLPEIIKSTATFISKVLLECMRCSI